MKRVLSLFFCLIMVMIVFAIVPFEAYTEENEIVEIGASSGTTGECTWTLSSDGVLTISGNGEMENYLYECGPWGDQIIEVVIENGVTDIGENAFTLCENLTSITIPDSVTSISDWAFMNCTSLTGLTIPNSVTSIGGGAFEYCTCLTSIAIPHSLRSIGGWAFGYCTGLTEITIPDSVTSIGTGAFTDCSGLVSIAVDNKNTVYDSRDNCNAIIETDTNKLITGCKNTVIPDSVMSIGVYAFSGCTGLTSITIPNSVTSIGGCAFWCCTELTSVTIQDSVTSIGFKAFEDCTNLKDVYYTGSEDDWNKINSNSGNDSLFNATIHYNSTGPVDKTHKTGDTDGDGEITIIDATTIQQWLAHIIGDDDLDFEAAKTTDNPVSVADVSRIQQHLARLINLEG